MKIFISWSDQRSEALAIALREWFPLVLHFVDPWLSKSDIQAGERWNVEVAKGLETCNFGVICITRENLNSPWILFESGALAKSMQDGRVIPLLLDLDFKEISGPLAQFQAKKADNNGIKELVLSLNKAATVPVPDAQLEKLFPALWGDLEKQINAIPKNASPTKHSRPQGEILEELVSNVRSMELRVRDVIDDEQLFRKRRRIRVHPEMLSEIMGRLGNGPINAPRDPIKLLFFASLLREDAPWVYEMGLEAYHSLRHGPKHQARTDLKRFIHAIELIQKAEFASILGLDRGVIEIARSDFYEVLRGLMRSVSEDRTDKQNPKLSEEQPKD